MVACQRDISKLSASFRSALTGTVKNQSNMKIIYFILLGLIFAFSAPAQQRPPNTSAVNYRLKIFHLKDSTQLSRVTNFLRDYFIPAAHRLGKKQIGVFTENNPEFGTNIYLFSQLGSLDELNTFDQQLLGDSQYAAGFSAYNAYDGKNTFYLREETIVLNAFAKMPFIEAPGLKAAKSARVYELRSYESPTEVMGVNKIKMFNEGNEVALFKRLNFNAVFYARVIAGNKMPNLMYMVTFENMADHNAKWAAFKDAPEWKALSALPEYQNNMNKVDAHFLTPMDYSDL